MARLVPALDLDLDPDFGGGVNSARRRRYSASAAARAASNPESIIAASGPTGACSCTMAALSIAARSASAIEPERLPGMRISISLLPSKPSFEV